MTVTLTSPFSARGLMLTLATNPELPTWHRVGCIAWHRADQGGHARFSTGELSRCLGLTRGQVSDALAVARRRGWVDQTSNARCVVLPGCALNPCEERHAA